MAYLCHFLGSFVAISVSCVFFSLLLSETGVHRKKKGDERGAPAGPSSPAQSAFMKSISTYTWQRAHMHGTKRAHQCLDPTPPHRTSHRTSPPSTNSHARSPGMEQHGSLDGDSRPIYARQASNRYLITCTRLFRSVPGGAVDCRHLSTDLTVAPTVWRVPHPATAV